MPRKATRIGRRQFVSYVSVAAIGATVAPVEAAQTIPAWTGAVLHAGDGLVIPTTPDGRKITIKIDSHVTPGVRMSMIAEDVPPKAEIRVHLHQREDEIIFIRTGTGIATLGDQEIAVAAGATIYVPQGVWHGLRNTGQETLGMSAIYSPPGFEQIFKQRLLRPDRTPEEIDADRKKYGILYRPIK
jgi:mannose-6-phosphate isomerase-like protein (cupin superfamily)